VAQVKAFGSMIVSNAIQTKQNKENETKLDPSLGDMSGSLINSLLDSIDDHRMVADAALNYLSAGKLWISSQYLDCPHWRFQGRDTTAQALTWTFYLLMRNPSQLESIRQEISAVLKTEPICDHAKLNTAVFRPASMPYVMAVFYETLRLYPPVPFEMKQCEQATTLPDGTFLPQHTILIWCTWAMNRSRLIWGEDADMFKPERWLENGNLISKTAFEFPVFNGGPRTCLGKKMAELVAVQVIATLVFKFDFKAVDDQERISKNSLTLPMEGGLPCYVSTRST
jgi:cytochrome P450